MKTTKTTDMKSNFITSFGHATKALFGNFGALLLCLFLLSPLGADVAYAVQPTYPTSGLVAHYNFEKDKKGRVADCVGQSHAKAKNVKYVDALIGKAAAFNGVNSKIVIDNKNGVAPAAIANLSVGTFSCWVKFENRGGQMLPIFYLGKNDSSMPSRSMIFEIGHDRGNIDNRRLYFTTIYSRGSNFCVDSGMNLTPGVWYHYVAVVSEQGSTIYLNGIEITTRRYNLGSTKSSSVFFDKVPSKELLSIGYGRYSQEEPFFSFNGLIDEVMIYNRPLEHSEVLTLFNMGGLEMGDAQLGYINAESMIGKEPIERGSAQGRGSGKGKGKGKGGRSSAADRENRQTDRQAERQNERWR